MHGLNGLRERLTYANVMATAAVFIALGGGAYAAATIDTSDIANRAVKGKKIAKGAVKASKLRDGAVTEPRIRDGAVSEPKILNGAVTTEKLDDDAVTGAKADESTFDTVPSATIAGNVLTKYNPDDVNSPAGTGFFEIIAIPDLPVGSYLIHAKLDVDNDDPVNPQDFSRCRILAEASEDRSEQGLEVSGTADDDEDNVSLMLPHTFAAPGSASLQCDNPGADAGDTEVQFARLTVLPVVSTTDLPLP